MPVEKEQRGERPDLQYPTVDATGDALRIAGSILARLLVLGAPFIGATLQNYLLVTNFSETGLSSAVAWFLGEISTAVFVTCLTAWAILTVLWIFSGFRSCLLSPCEGLILYPAVGLYLWAFAPTAVATIVAVPNALIGS